MMIATVLATLSAATAAGNTHMTTIEHGGAPLTVAYQADLDISHRQIGGLAPPGRQSSLRCLWTADVAVDRQVRRDGVVVPALSRRVSTREHLTGSRPGSCEQARAGIAREVAARGRTVRDHLAEVAERDRAAILAEIESANDLSRRLG